MGHWKSFEIGGRYTTTMTINTSYTARITEGKLCSLPRCCLEALDRHAKKVHIFEENALCLNSWTLVGNCSAMTTNNKRMMIVNAPYPVRCACNEGLNFLPAVCVLICIPCVACHQAGHFRRTVRA